MGWSVFEFASGSNDYIATKEWRRKELLRKFDRLGWGVKRTVSPQGLRWYTVNDRRGF